MVTAGAKEVLMAWRLCWSHNVEGDWKLTHQWLSTRPPPHRCCPALSCCAVLCCAVLCCAVPCPAMPCPAMPCPALPCCVLPCCVLMCCALPCPAVLHRICLLQPCAVLSYSCNVLGHAALCCAVLGSAAQQSSTMCRHAVDVCRGLRPLANAQGQNSVSSDLRCMALAGWSQGTGQEGASQHGPLQAHIVTASSDATMSLLHFDVHACRSARMLNLVKMLSSCTN